MLASLFVFLYAAVELSFVLVLLSGVTPVLVFSLSLLFLCVLTLLLSFRNVFPLLTCFRCRSRCRSPPASPSLCCGPVWDSVRCCFRCRSRCRSPPASPSLCCGPVWGSVRCRCWWRTPSMQSMCFWCGLTPRLQCSIFFSPAAADRSRVATFVQCCDTWCRSAWCDFGSMIPRSAFVRWGGKNAITMNVYRRRSLWPLLNAFESIWLELVSGTVMRLWEWLCVCVLGASFPSSNVML